MNADRDGASVGRPAPEFDLPATRGGDEERARLAFLRGRWVVLIFYPRDFSFVCPTELTSLSSRINEFRSRGCDLIAVSVDSIETHDRWIAAGAAEGGLDGIAFPLASDETGAVCREYGVYREEHAVAQRALFVIDPAGILQYQVVHAHNVGRGTEEILRVLGALQTGGFCGADFTTQHSEPIDLSTVLRPGRIVSHYRIEEELGSGGAATVFRATDLILERPVALKIFKTSGIAAPESVITEARSAAALTHPNVAAVYAVDDSIGLPFIAMELVRGAPLARLIADAPLPVARVRSLGRQVAAALATAHAQGITHGDLKPANVLVTDDDVAKVVDFGLARHDPRSIDPNATADLDAGESSSGVWVVGTPAYLSPEQARGQPARPTSDVFALGLLLDEMLTATRRIEGENVLELLANVHTLDGEAVAADHADPTIADVIRRALIANPAERKITMDEIARMLDPS